MTHATAAELLSLGPVTGHVVGNAHTTVIVYPVAAAADPLDWVVDHREPLRAGLRGPGATLLRGCPADIGFFHEVVQIIGGDPLPYTERSTPRHAVSGHIYTSTEYPAAQAIPQHNENSYSDRWPDTLFFCCQVAARTGGATPLADSRAVCRLLPQPVRERFAAGVTYTRMFRQGLGLSWQESFQTDDRAVVEDYCTRHGLRWEWLGDDLRTRHLRPATQLEPHGGMEVWFNQAHLFHVSSLDPDVRDALLSIYPEDELPRQAYLGDGGPITAADLTAIAAAYDEASFVIDWQPGDIIVIDNMLMSHGRQPYTGDRSILVAMT